MEVTGLAVLTSGEDLGTKVGLSLVCTRIRVEATVVEGDMEEEDFRGDGWKTQPQVVQGSCTSFGFDSERNRKQWQELPLWTKEGT
jgi:hypothetical protein